MTMQPVQSSNLAAIGYDGDTRSMRVRFNDGAEYEYPEVDATKFEEFKVAKSKGRWLNQFVALRAGVRLANAAPDPVAVRAEGGPVHTSQADGCCCKHLNNASLSGKLDKLEVFTCPKCGTEYKPKAYGPLVNWEACCDALIVRPGRR